MSSIRAYIPSSEAPGRIALANVPEPEPEPSEALVTVEAYSVNRGEVFLLDAPRDGWRPGHVPAGGWAERVAGDDHGMDLLTGSQAKRVVPAVTSFIRQG